MLSFRLQEDYTKSQDELKQLLVEKQTVHDKFQQLLADFQDQLLAKTQELEQMKLQVRKFTGRTWYVFLSCSRAMHFFLLMQHAYT